jgi:hypothetical protein
MFASLAMWPAVHAQPPEIPLAVLAHQDTTLNGWVLPASLIAMTENTEIHKPTCAFCAIIHV